MIHGVERDMTARHQNRGVEGWVSREKSSMADNAKCGRGFSELSSHYIRSPSGR